MQRHVRHPVSYRGVVCWAYGNHLSGHVFSVAKLPKNMLFRNASEIQNDRVIIFYLGCPAPSCRRRAIRIIG